MSWEPHVVGAHVVDADGRAGTVKASRVVFADIWGWAASRVTKVDYGDGELDDVVEYEDDSAPMLSAP